MDFGFRFGEVSSPFGEFVGGESLGFCALYGSYLVSAGCLELCLGCVEALDLRVVC